MRRRSTRTVGTTNTASSRWFCDRGHDYAAGWGTIALVRRLVFNSQGLRMTPLKELAARYGIEESFRDARGRVQITTPATRHALLAAMGVPANTEEAAIDALHALDRDEWLHSLPAVHVAVEAAPISVPITFAAGTGTLIWRLFL